jgi:DNA replication protein DnaC
MNAHLSQTLRELRLSGALDSLEVRLQEATANALPHEQFLELILQDELMVRKQRKIERRKKAADFREQKSLEDFDFRFNPSVPRARIHDLAACHFIREARDVLIVGPPGVGKSHLAQALGHQAVKNGFTVLYRSIFDTVRDLNDEERYHADSRLLSRYLKPDLLILDDMGIKQLPAKAGEYLFEIIMRRYETRSTLMTSNRPIEEWGKLIGDVPSATAILDRLLHHAELINIKGRSYRLRGKTHHENDAERGGAHCRPPHPPARATKLEESKSRKTKHLDPVTESP